MTANDIFNWPHFVVPIEAPQPQLLLSRTGVLGKRGWHLKTEDGTRYGSPAVYFGSLILHPDDTPNDSESSTGSEGGAVGDDPPAESDTPEARLRAALGFGREAVVRLDYACTDDDTFFLRVGEPGGKPVPYSAFTKTAVKRAERFIARFLGQKYRSIIMQRSVQCTAEDILFADEDELFEGFLGEDGMPMRVQKALGPRLATVGNSYLMSFR